MISSSPRSEGRNVVDDVEDLRVVHVDADHGQVALGLLRLFVDADDAAGHVQFGDAEALGIGALP